MDVETKTFKYLLISEELYIVLLKVTKEQKGAVAQRKFCYILLKEKIKPIVKT